MARYVDIDKFIEEECNPLSCEHNTTCIECFYNKYPVDVEEVVYAAWDRELAANGWVDNICSNCGYTINEDIHVYIDYNYCPNCGAKMEKEV